MLLINDLSENFNVLNSFLESVLLSFETGQDVGLSDTLCSLEFFVGDGGQSLQFTDSSLEELVGVAGSTSDGETEKTRVREVEVDGVDSIDVAVLVEEVGQSSAVESSGAGVRAGVSEEGIYNLQDEDIVGSPLSRLESQSQSGDVFIVLVSVFTSQVFSSLSLGDLTLDGRNEGELGLNELNEFLVIFNTSSSNEDSVGVDVFKLELLEDVGVQVFIVVGGAVEWVSEASVSVGSLEEGVVDQMASLQQSFEFVLVVHFAHGSISSNDGSWLKSAVSDHVEHINNVVGKAVGSEVGAFLVVIHFEFTSRHLDHTIVDSLICIEDGFIVGLLDGVESSGGLVSLISGTDIEKDTEVNNVGEDLRFGNDGDSVFELSNLVIWGLVLSVLDFVG